MHAEQNDLQYAAPGGLIGVGTKIDPTLCRGDRMVGQVLGAVGALPDIFTELEISYFLLRRLLGVKTEGDKKGAKVSLFSTCTLVKSHLYLGIAYHNDEDNLSLLSFAEFNFAVLTLSAKNFLSFLFSIPKM